MFGRKIELARFRKLKSCLEGKTIFAIEPPDIDEGICKFMLTDGTAFRLWATDLGYGIEEIMPSDGQFYCSLSTLIKSVGDHLWDMGAMPRYNYIVPDPKVIFKGDFIQIKTADKQIFKANVGCFDVWGREVCASPKAVKLITDACNAGILWRDIFSARNKKCPSKLYLLEGNKKKP